MIVCSCNVLTDHQIQTAALGSPQLLLNAQQIYVCLGCSMRCGRCAPTVKRIAGEAGRACAGQIFADNGWARR
jgi:bacterioferritin-associated ferredoxin